MSHPSHRGPSGGTTDDPLEFPYTGNTPANPFDTISLEFPDTPKQCTPKRTKPEAWFDFDKIDTPVQHS